MATVDDILGQLFSGSGNWNDILSGVAQMGNTPTLQDASTFGVNFPNLSQYANQPTFPYEQAAGMFFNGPAAGNPMVPVQENAGIYSSDMGSLAGFNPAAVQEASGLFGANMGNLANQPTAAYQVDLGNMANQTANDTGTFFNPTGPFGYLNGQWARQGYMGNYFAPGTTPIQQANGTYMAVDTNGDLVPVMGASPTLSAQEQTGYIGSTEANPYGGGSQVILGPGTGAGQVAGVPTVAEQTLQSNTALDYLKLLSSLQSSPFQQELVARGATAQGIPNSVAALTGIIPQLGNFGNFGVTPTAPSINQFATGASGGTTNPGAGVQMQPLGSTMGQLLSPQAGPAANAGINADMSVAALQNTPVNQWHPQDYFQAIQSQSGRDFVNSALQAAGLSPSDVDTTMKNLLPQFNAPKFGTVNPGGSIGGAANQV